MNDYAVLENYIPVDMIGQQGKLSLTEQGRNAIINLRENPNHDPDNGQFTEGGGNGNEGSGKGRLLKINLSFFSESDIKNQNSTSLKKAIRKYEKRIKEHQQKIDTPEKFVEDWDNIDERRQKGLIKHWEKEITNFNNSIDARTKELKERGDTDE